MPFMQYFKWGGIILLLIALLGIYSHYNSVVSERNLLAQNNAVLTEAFEREKEATKKLQALLDKAYEKFDEFESTLEDFSENQKTARKELEALNGKFRKHDLEALAKKKPGLIEDRLNSGTRDTFRMLEESTEPGLDGSSSK